MSTKVVLDLGQEILEHTNYASIIDMPGQIDRLTDFYYEHHWSDEFATLFGIHDISSEFNVTPSALNFLNSSFGTDTSFATSSANGPSIYPLTTAGIRAKYKLMYNVDLLTGIYDGDPGDQSTWRKTTPKMSRDDGRAKLSILVLVRGSTPKKERKL